MATNFPGVIQQMSNPKRPGRPAQRLPMVKNRQKRPNPHPIDIHVGARLRLRRVLLGLSQADLGERVGLTFQQIQKYERGANRIGASRLYELTQILDVPVSFFFDGIANSDSDKEPADGRRAVRRHVPSQHSDDAVARVASAYFGVGSEPVQRSMLGLMRALERHRDRRTV